MAASDHLQPRQLQMFMTGGDIQAMVNTSANLRGNEKLPDMWNRKEQESKQQPTGDSVQRWKHGGEAKPHGAGVYDSLDSNGWQGKPLNIHHGDGWSEVKDGHHRVAAAAGLSRSGREVYIPVNHVDDFDVLPTPGNIL